MIGSLILESADHLWNGCKTEEILFFQTVFIRQQTMGSGQIGPLRWFGGKFGAQFAIFWQIGPRQIEPLQIGPQHTGPRKTWMRQLGIYDICGPFWARWSEKFKIRNTYLPQLDMFWYYGERKKLWRFVFKACRAWYWDISKKGNTYLQRKYFWQSWSYGFWAFISEKYLQLLGFQLRGCS